MPGTKALEEFKRGALHSGSKHGPLVTNRKQAVAIYLSEKRKSQNAAQQDALKKG